MSLPSHVSLFLTCSAETLYPSVGQACVKVLEAAGFTVEFRQEQTCCGQKWLNSNELAEAKTMARHFLKVFEDAEVVVAPSSSCVDTIRNGYPDLFKEDPQLHSRFVALGQKTYEFCEFFDKAGIKELPTHPAPVTTTYHSTCRTLRGIGLQGVAEVYLEQMLGEHFIPLPDSETCCGFGGTFSVKLPEVSGLLMQDKLDAIISTGAETVTALDLSCLTHLTGGAKREGRNNLRFVHLAELIAEALEGGQQ